MINPINSVLTMSKQNKTETAISELMKKLTSLKGQVDMLEHINEKKSTSVIITYIWIWIKSTIFSGQELHFIPFDLF